MSSQVDQHPAIRSLARAVGLIHQRGGVVKAQAIVLRVIVGIAGCLLLSVVFAVLSVPLILYDVALAVVVVVWAIWAFGRD